MGEVMQETLMMIPDCHRRLLAAHSELTNLLETEAELNVDGEVEEFVVALAQIKEAEDHMKVEWYIAMLNYVLGLALNKNFSKGVPYSLHLTWTRKNAITHICF